MSDDDLRKLDAELAEKVMPWHRVHNDAAREDEEVTWMFYRDRYVLRGDPYPLKGSRLFSYSFSKWMPTENIADAFQIVDSMRRRGLHLMLNDTMATYRARFFDQHWEIDEWVRAPDSELTAWEKTAPFAICRAALAHFKEEK